MNKKLLFLSACLGMTQWVAAQAPNGYYDSADSLVGEELRIELREIIRNQTVRSYSALWDGYNTTDRLPDGTIWDIYSHNPNGPQYYSFTYRTNQCGSYSSEGDCYNREHTWPQSMFGDGNPMRTDIVLVLPTDGKVNGQRGNSTYGKVSAPSWTSQNGSKLGRNTYPGSPNTTAFEPIDEYKGDIARIMFYVVTRYYKLDSGWQTWDMGIKAELTPWAKNMFLEWHAADPVSDKERDRNNAIYNFQGNRNPYVDHPEFVACVFDPANCIWGTQDTTSVDTSTSIPQLLDNKSIKLYPNPAVDVLTLQWSNLPSLHTLKFNLIDVTGKIVYKSEFTPLSSTHDIDVSQLPAGMYVVKLSNEDIFYIDKFVKN